MVLLGLNASIDKLAASFEEARHSTTCRGFMVGRTIFQEPSRRWLAGQIDDATLISQVRANFEQLVHLWQRTRNHLERAA